MTTVLVAVHDSAAAFAAADTAVDLTRRMGGRLCVVAVVDPEPTLLGPHATATLAHRDRDADAALRHVARAAEHAGVQVATRLRHGRIAREILVEARSVSADVIVMALVDRPGHAIPHVGSHTLRVLEFADVPVLVVPPPAAG